MGPPDTRSSLAPTLVAAGFVSRLAAFVIDLVVLGAGAGAIAWAVDAAEAVLLPSVLGSWERTVLGGLMALFGAVSALAYFVGCWCLGGRTVGMLLLGLRVVPAGGGSMTLGRALVRFVGYALSAVPLYAGFLWVLVDPSRRGWHDLLARTHVVYDPAPDERARRARERAPRAVRSVETTALVTLVLAALVAPCARPAVAQDDEEALVEPQGTVTTADAAARDLSTPRRALATFLAAARDGEWETAATVLDLREVPRGQRAATGEQAARDLEIVLSAEGVVPDDAPDDEEPGGDRAIELLRFAGVDQGVVLRRISSGGKTAWSFSAGTVRAAGDLRGQLDRGPLGDLVPEVLREPRLLSLEPWQWLAIPAAVLLALVGAVILGRVTTGIAGRLARRVDREPFTLLLSRLRFPVRGGYALAILGLLAIPIHFPQRFLAIPGRLYAVAWAIVIGWCFWRAVDFVAEKIEARAVAQDDWRARQLATRASAVRRMLHVGGVALAVAIVMLQIEPIRELGISILASAGVAGIVLGIAAQRTIGNLIAGIQLSFTQPLRVGDEVMIADHFGTVEEITLSYVVMRLPDHRRFVVPISTLLETPFENWTRLGTDILGTIEFPVDFTAPIERLRTELSRYVHAHPLFDGATFDLLVSEVREHTAEVRVRVSASDSSKLWDLRCAVREFLMQFLQELDGGRHLPRLRIDEPARARRALRGELRSSAS